MFVYEELLMKDYKVDVTDMIGWEGLWGMLVSFVVLLITTFCTDQSFLPKDDIVFATN